MGFLDKAKQIAGEAAAKAKEEAADLQDKAGPAFEKGKQDAGELAGKAKEKLSK